MMKKRIVRSNGALIAMLKKNALNFDSGAVSFLMGDDLRTRSRSYIHSFCFSVRRSLPPSLSCSELKVLMTTPTKRFKKKKEPTMIKRMKNNTHIGFEGAFEI